MREQALAFYKKILEQYRPMPVDELAASLTPPVSRARIEDWRAAGRIFSVSFEGKELYPTFLFEDGGPKEVVARILKLLRESKSPTEAEVPYSDWSTLCWFVGANAWRDGETSVDGDTPVNQMDSNPEAVVYAASHMRDRISD